MDFPVGFVAPFLSFSLIGGGIVYVFILVVRSSWAKRRAENKVRMSDLILVSDIKILARMNSRLLDDAIVLRSAQIEPPAA